MNMSICALIIGVSTMSASVVVQDPTIDTVSKMSLQHKKRSIKKKEKKKKTAITPQLKTIAAYTGSAFMAYMLYVWMTGSRYRHAQPEFQPTDPVVPTDPVSLKTVLVDTSKGTCVTQELKESKYEEKKNEKNSEASNYEARYDISSAGSEALDVTHLPVEIMEIIAEYLREEEQRTIDCQEGVFEVKFGPAASLCVALFTNAGTMHMCDVATGEKKWSFQTGIRYGNFMPLDFWSDRVVTARGNQGFILGANNGERIHTLGNVNEFDHDFTSERGEFGGSPDYYPFQNPHGRISRVAFSPKTGAKVFTAGYKDRRACIWDAKTGALLYKIPWTLRPYIDVTTIDVATQPFNESETLLFSTDVEGSVVGIHDPDTGTLLRKITVPGQVSIPQFIPGNHIVLLNRDNTILRGYKIKQGGKEKKLTLGEEKVLDFESGTHVLCPQNDEKHETKHIIMCRAGDSYAVFDMKDGYKYHESLRCRDVQLAQYSSRILTLMLCGFNIRNQGNLWQFSDQYLTQQFINSACFADRGRKVVIAAQDYLMSRGDVCVFDISDTYPYIRHSTSIKSIGTTRLAADQTGCYVAAWYPEGSQVTLLSYPRPLIGKKK